METGIIADLTILAMATVKVSAFFVTVILSTVLLVSLEFLTKVR